MAKKSLVSPKGIARYPHLNEPTTKFVPEGQYEVGLVLSPEEDENAQAFINFLEKTVDEAHKEATRKTRKKLDKHVPIRYLTDEEGNETGEVSIPFTTKASGFSKKTGKAWTRTIPLFDSKGNPITDKVGGGSVIKVAYTMGEPWNKQGKVGIKLYLDAVQVLDLKTWGERDASSFGFEEEEGYSVDERADFDGTFTDDDSDMGEEASYEALDGEEDF